MAERIKVKYPKFLILYLADYGPHLYTFETSGEVADFCWGRDLSSMAIFKDGQIVHPQSNDVDEIRKQLDG